MLIASSLIDLGALGKIVLAGFAGGAGVVVAFGFVLLGRARYADARAGTATRGAAVATAVLGAAFCVAALVLGFIAMTHK